jgi:hypothetical protein
MARLPDETQLLALALLNHSDDHGFFHADPEIVRAACMPFRESLPKISEGLTKLSGIGWIEISKHSEHGLIGRIINWSKHQRVYHPSPSKLEAYFIPENICNPHETFGKPHETFGKPHETFGQEQGTGKGKEQGREGPPPLKISDELQDLAFRVYGDIPVLLPDAVALYSEAWVKQAISRTAEAGNRDWRYTAGILRSYQKQGGPDKNTNSQSKPREVRQPRQPLPVVQVLREMREEGKRIHEEDVKNGLCK